MSKVSEERAKTSQSALLAMFFTQGLLMTTQIPRVPELIKQIGVDYNQWGLILGFAASGSIIGLLNANRFIARFGAQRVAQTAAIAVTALLASFSFITNPILFFAANICFSLAMACFNISVNSQSVILQNALKRVILGRFHGTWAIGAMLSAALAGYLTTVVSIKVHFVGMAIFCLTAFLAGSRFLLTKAESQEAERTKKPPHTPLFKTPLKVWLLAIGLFVAVSPELALMDWSAVYSRDALGIQDSGLRTIPYTVFMIFMIIGRLSIGRLTKRWHISELASVGGFVAFLGLGTSILLAPTLSTVAAPFAVITGSACWAVAGLGSSTLVPSFFSASGHVKGMDTATVMSRMSLAQTFLIIATKILIGAIAENTDIRTAFLVPCGLVLICAVIARVLVRGARREDVLADPFPMTMPIPNVQD